MKILITALGTLLISFPLLSQTTNFSAGSGNQPGTDMAPASGQTPNSTAPITTSPVTGSPTFDPGNTAVIPPSTLDSNSPVTGTGAETAGSAAGIGTGTGTGTGVGVGTGVPSTVPQPGAPIAPINSAPVPPATGTTQPSGSMMNPSGGQSGTQGWQGI